MPPSAIQTTLCVLLCRYVTWNNRVNFAEETKLSATKEEERAWVAERRASGGDASTSSPPDYPFICEVCVGLRSED